MCPFYKCKISSSCFYSYGVFFKSILQIPETSYVVKDLSEGTDYEFRVAAENKAGVGPFSPPSKPIKAIDIIVGEAPAVLEGVPDVVVTAGETALLACKINGDPIPSIKWSVYILVSTPLISFLF